MWDWNQGGESFRASGTFLESGQHSPQHSSKYRAYPIKEKVQAKEPNLITSLTFISFLGEVNFFGQILSPYLAYKQLLYLKMVVLIKNTVLQENFFIFNVKKYHVLKIR